MANLDQNITNIQNSYQDMIDFKLFQNEIDYISTNFCDIDKSKILKLDKNLIELIIHNEKLQLKDEDSLLQFLIDIYAKDHQQSYLFEYVEFLNVSQEGFLAFFNIFDVCDINLKIWNSLFERIFQSKNQDDDQYCKLRSKRYKKNLLIHSFPYFEGNEFNGIIKYLTNKTGGNIHDNGTINVSSNSIYGSKSHPKNLLNFNDSTSYHSNDQSNVWICFDFKNMEVEIDHYTIESYYCPANYGGHIKNWVIEISNDGESWTQIDNRSNCSDLNGNRKIATFDVIPNGYSRYVRFYHTGTCWDDYKTNNCTIFFLSIEFYGNLRFI